MIEWARLELPAFDDALYLLVRHVPDRDSGWAHCPLETPCRFVNVQSAHRGGTSRSYWWDGGDHLEIATPNYLGDWPELDSAVRIALGIPSEPTQLELGLA